jgi:hypothetical protein
MILYGAVKNSFSSYITHTHFTLYGGIITQAGPEQIFSFPILGPVVSQVYPAAKFSLLGPTLVTVNPAIGFKQYSAKLTITTTGINISGLVISDIAILKTFDTPSLSYSIYPFIISDVKLVLGTTLPYQIVNNDLMFTTLPEGPITIIPYNRLQIYAEEVKQLHVVNTVSSRLEYSDIVVSGDFQFSLNPTGPWSTELEVIDTFYIKAPTLAVDGSDYSKSIDVRAMATPLA